MMSIRDEHCPVLRERIRGERGFTLIELLVAMVVTVIVFSATLSVLDAFQSNNRFDQLRNENQDMARTTLDRLSRQLRNIVARTTSSGIVPGALEQAEDYAITFQTIDTTKASSGKNEVNAMRVRYCLNDSNPENEILWEEVRRWEEKEAPELPSSTSCPDRTTGDWNTLTQVVPHVTNRIGGQSRPLFTYSAKETPEILSVETDLFININPKQSRPGESQLTSGVSLRNANRRPVAEFTATEEGTNGKGERYVRLNASPSYDPDGLSLKYKWWDNEEELMTTSQEYTTKAFAVGSAQKFKLVVTNPGDLSATAEKAVTIK